MPAEKQPIPQGDKVDISGSDGDKLTLMEKSALGIEMLGDTIYRAPGVQSFYTIKEAIKDKLTDKLMKPIHKVVNWIAGDKDDDEMEEVHQVGKENLEKFAGNVKEFPGQVQVNRQEKKPAGNAQLSEEEQQERDEFWDNHPILHSMYLGAQAVRKIPKFVYKMAVKIPRAIFKVAFPALYANEGSSSKFVGKSVYDKVIGWASKSDKFRYCYDTSMKMMQVPGVALAVSIVAPALGVSRMVDGINIYNEGKKENDPKKRLEGKVEMMSGALATIRPLAILAVVNEGVHAYLNHRVRKGTLDPEKADQMMTRVFSAAAAPIGLAAYALLKSSHKPPAGGETAPVQQPEQPSKKDLLATDQGYLSQGYRGAD